MDGPVSLGICKIRQGTRGGVISATPTPMRGPRPAPPTAAALFSFPCGSKIQGEPWRSSTPLAAAVLWVVGKTSLKGCEPYEP